MKLKNKKTEEIKDTAELMYPDGIGRFFSDFNSLSELNEEWEDYEEPKDVWWIDNEGNVHHATSEVDDNFEMNREIGNYFKSKEEAEKAVEKLKAWKRLKDEYDFKFTGWKRDEQFRGDFIITAQDWNTSDDKLLNLLFGGEE